MPDPATQSLARQLASKVAENLIALIGEPIDVRSLWHPSFASKEELKSTIVTVRPGRRGRTADGRVTGPRDVDIEIAIVRHLPPPETRESDPYNDMATIDALDLLAEKIFDMFCRVDEDEYPAPAGVLANVCLCGFTAKSPDQPSTLENSLLESDRLFLTIITVPFQRME